MDAPSYIERLEAGSPRQPPSTDPVQLPESGIARTEVLDTSHHAQTVEIPKPWAEPMPEHWDTPEKPLQKALFSLLCVGALGQYSMEKFWEACQDDETYKHRKEGVMNRLQNISVVASLLLAALSVTLTTPPPLPHLLDYTQPVPYIFLCNAFSATLTVIIFSSAILYSMTEMRRIWFVESFAKTRSNVYAFLVLLSFPYAQIGLALGSAVLGLLIAALSSQDTLLRVDAAIFIAVPCLSVPVYLFSLRYPRRPHEQVESGEGSRDEDSAVKYDGVEDERTG
ncbi:hypothetical protein NM688_g6641 [Phlebia brevispora]|uniref:Uncharacterized protein n=1 Tax=Phlebia brevispora TaxID=194682 RepID=A0ACC1SE35_9APHY|nr:hypothetical protein NM688_g6641 [Phlebia brevispora]